MRLPQAATSVRQILRNMGAPHQESAGKLEPFSLYNVDGDAEKAPVAVIV
jgi:hypothetical protein